MFEKLWALIAIPLGYVMKYCYILAHDVMNLPVAYLWALLFFTILTKILLFPLSINQQKQTAKMAALKPMLDEIQKTYAKDPKRQQEETYRLQEEVGYNPMSGCLPLLIQFPILFGLVEVIYKPLTYMLQLPSELVTKLTEIVNTIPGAVSSNSRFIETNIIEQVKTNISAFSSVTSNPEYTEWIDKITNLDMSIGSMNLWDVPSIKQPSLVWLVVLFSISTMVLSSFISMKNSGSADAQGARQARTMMISMALLFAVFSFSYPAGFSLYWGFSNLVVIGQSFLLKKIINPEKLREKVMQEMKEKRKSAKKSTMTTVKVKDPETGEIVEKTLSKSELEKLRLQKARELKDSPYDS